MDSPDPKGSGLLRYACCTNASKVSIGVLTFLRRKTARVRFEAEFPVSRHALISLDYAAHIVTHVLCCYGIMDILVDWYTEIPIY